MKSVLTKHEQEQEDAQNYNNLGYDTSNKAGSTASTTKLVTCDLQHLQNPFDI